MRSIDKQAGLHGVAWGAALVLLSLLSTTARAEADPAEAFISQGRELMQAQRYTEALDAFARGRSLTRSPVPVAQVGLAEQALSRWVQAESHLRESLAYPEDPFIQQHKAQLEQALIFVRHHLALLRIVGTPSGAVVRVNGESVATVPLEEPLYWWPGKTRITLVSTAVDYVCPTVETDLSAGEAKDLQMECRKAPGPQAPLAKDGDRTATDGPRLLLVSSARSNERDHLIAGIAAAGTGALAAEGGIALVTSVLLMQDGDDHNGRLLAVAGAGCLGAAAALFFVWRAYSQPASPRAGTTLTLRGLAVAF